MKKVLVLNISTDSKNTSLGFAISWLNAFAKKFDEVHVISLSKGSDDELEKNIVVSSVDNELGRVSKIINLYKLINKLTKSHPGPTKSLQNLFKRHRIWRTTSQDNFSGNLVNTIQIKGRARRVSATQR